MNDTSRHISRRIACIAALLLGATSAQACSRSVTVYDDLPLNHEGIPNSTRLKIADMAIRSKLYPLQFPGVKIEVIVIGGAYVGERHPKALAERRRAAVEAYVVQLGFPAADVISDTALQRHARIRKDGTLELESIVVAFSPTCADGQSGQGDCNFPCTPPGQIVDVRELPARIEKL